MNFFELFQEEMEEAGRRINKWINETREARALYQRMKEEEKEKKGE